MDTIENIIKRIQEDAEWKVKEYNEIAEKEIEKIRLVEEARWHEEKERLEAIGKREAETIKQMHISKAHLDGRKMLMNAREKVIHQIIAEMLNNFRKYVNYEKYLEDSLGDAQGVLGDNFKIICNAEDKEIIKKIAEKMGLKVEIEDGNVDYGGFLAVSSDSLKKVDYSASAFIERNIGDIRKKIYVKLFGEEYA